ncbi:MAG: phage shock protein operon transcriptional activator [Opitutales bacterium]|nr:phage shock protein operon transcriptional activator [Opitutales bacterium]
MPTRDRTRTSDPSVLDRTPRAEPLGESEAFIEFNEHLSRVAKVDRPVLIVGERGTGKELAVHRLHYLSARWQGPLVALNCAALSPSVLESELFGHEAGAFTGAMRRRQGRFEAAEGGTLFLDEIGLIPMQVQEKILRVVEYREFERVGGSDPVRVDVRIVGATNANLPAMAREGRFKADLLDRLTFEVLYLPPLRRRPEDILLLARHFLTRMAMELGREPPELSARAEQQLEAHAWPGNIRELKNAVERAVYRCPGRAIKEIDFDPFGRVEWGGASAPAAGPAPGPAAVPAHGGADAPPAAAVPSFAPGGGESLTDALRRFELNALREALEAARYHQGEAAKRLGLTYHQFRGLFRKYKDEFPQ